MPAAGSRCRAPFPPARIHVCRCFKHVQAVALGRHLESANRGHGISGLGLRLALTKGDLIAVRGGARQATALKAC
eukprot:363441-Chlamydomonas_euryale.AAC.1